jgi:cephalosporin hydroxylase
MSLKSLIDNERTDKDTTHSYIDLYDKLLSKRKETAFNILEIGIYLGGSIRLWADYFTYATIYGLDTMPIDYVWNGIKNKKNIILHTSTNAYDEEYFNYTLLQKNIKFDMILDDGPHTLESMKTFIKLYSQLLTNDGILIIEDVQSIDWLEYLIDSTPDKLKQYITTYDLRTNKKRYDDIVFTIDKSLS